MKEKWSKNSYKISWIFPFIGSLFLDDFGGHVGFPDGFKMGPKCIQNWIIVWMDFWMDFFFQLKGIGKAKIIKIYRFLYGLC